MSLFFSLQLPFLLFVILAICLLVGIGGNSLVRRMGWQVTIEDNVAINLTHALAGVLYAVALGLMVVNVQSGYTEVKLVVMKEANLIGDLYIDAHGLSNGEGEKIQALIEAYEGTIIDEWHEIGDRSDSELPSHKLVQELTREFLAYEPKRDKDLVIYAEMLGGFNNMLDMRRSVYI